MCVCVFHVVVLSSPSALAIAHTTLTRNKGTVRIYIVNSNVLYILGQSRTR